MSWFILRCVLIPLAAPVLVVQDSEPASGSGPVPVAGAMPRASVSAPTTDPTAAIRIYRASCLKCHDTDGKGEIVRDVMAKIPDFTDAAWHAKRSEADLGRSILEGKGKSMPAMRGKLGSVHITQMVSFVRAFRGGKQVVEEEEEAPAEPPRPAEPVIANGPDSHPAESSRPGPRDLGLREVSRTFQRSCAACHGTDGRGGEVRGNFPEIPDFTARAWQEAHNDSRLVVSVLDGKGTGMPAFREKLSREQARDLVAFVRSLGPSPMRAAAPPPDDFEARFRQLLAEFEGFRERSRALSAEATSTRPVAPEPGTPPPPRQSRRDEDQSSGDGRRGAGG